MMQQRQRLIANAHLPIADTDNSVVNGQTTRSTDNADYNDVSVSIRSPV
jgi:hypothetical protein